MPDFGTRLYEYIFQPNDTITFNIIEEEIRTAVKRYIPNLEIKSITIVPADQDPDEEKSVSDEMDERLFRVSDSSSKPYTAKVKLDYAVNNEPFESSDFIIINI